MSTLDHEQQMLIVNSICHEALMTGHTQRQMAVEVAEDQTRPSVLFRPSLSRDGNQWCALYGTNLQDGVCGFGTTPDAAMKDFDRAWKAA